MPDVRKRIYRMLGSMVDPEKLGEELHVALASIICTDHKCWPKPCISCKETVRNLVKPLARSLVRSAMAVNSPDLDDPHKKRRRPNPTRSELVAAGQGLEIILHEAKILVYGSKPELIQAVVITEQPLEQTYNALGA